MIKKRFLRSTLIAALLVFACLCTILLASCHQNVLDAASESAPIETDVGSADANFIFTPSDDRMSNRLPALADGISPIRPMDGALYLVDRSMVYRYSIETGGVIPLCNDPLCMHNSTDCPFYGLNTVLRMIHASNNNIFYAQDYMQWDAALGKVT